MPEVTTYDSYGKSTNVKHDCVNKEQFTGKEIDEDSGLYYFCARYYDPEVGRFLSEDPVPHVNAYIYCDDNPINRVDPDGREDEEEQKSESQKKSEEIRQDSQSAKQRGQDLPTMTDSQVIAGCIGLAVSTALPLAPEIGIGAEAVSKLIQGATSATASQIVVGSALAAQNIENAASAAKQFIAKNPNIIRAVVEMINGLSKEPQTLNTELGMSATQATQANTPAITKVVANPDYYKIMQQFKK